MLKASFACRGRILQLSIQMETLMDLYIAQQFFDNEDKQSDFSTLLLSEVGLNKKSGLFMYLLEKTPGSLSRTYLKAFRKKIVLVIDERNLFAHYPIAFNGEAIEKFNSTGAITFVKMRRGRHEGKEQVGLRYVYTEAAVNTLIAKIVDIINTLEKLCGMDSSFKKEDEAISNNP